MQSEIDSRYIGIAKLCCGFCDKYLDMEEYNHRGTHGVQRHSESLIQANFSGFACAHVLLYAAQAHL
ncbi:hypothetical protein [Rickettsia endosymbiont of Orchestes rusci]|uniref:hypothetical protein n=1 Tax=Rickettsia endosymbiont of Orchestes rusci TaxID=3066250 RepID=UPI00397AF89D